MRNPRVHLAGPWASPFPGGLPDLARHLPGLDRPGTPRRRRPLPFRHHAHRPPIGLDHHRFRYPKRLTISPTEIYLALGKKYLDEAARARREGSGGAGGGVGVTEVEKSGGSSACGGGAGAGAAGGGS
jgi:hypothetical protein